MNAKTSIFHKMGILILAISLFPSFLTAQSPWMDRAYSSSVNAEWFKPTFDANLDENDTISFLSSVLFVTGRHQVFENLWIVGELPFSHWELKDDDGIDTQAPHTTIGNIYVGSEYHYPVNANSISSFVEFGLRFQTMPDPDFPNKRGNFTGYYSAIDRREAFIIDFTPLVGMANVTYRVNDFAMLRIRGGVSYWIDSAGNEWGNQLYLAQSVQAHFQTDQLGGHLGITGKYNVDTDDILEEDDITQLQAGLSKQFRGWTGTFYLRRPLVSNSYVRLVYGLKIDINI